MVKFKIAILLVVQLCLTAAPAIAEESKPAASNAQPAQAGSMISANGFACSMVEGQALCQGKFEEVDKDLVFGAKGNGNISLRVKRGDDLFTYSSSTGCLCEEGKKEITCRDSRGKKETFKDDKRQEQSSAFCSTKK